MSYAMRFAAREAVADAVVRAFARYPKSKQAGATLLMQALVVAMRNVRTVGGAARVIDRDR